MSEKLFRGVIQLKGYPFPKVIEEYAPNEEAVELMVSLTYENKIYEWIEPLDWLPF